ncbi:hypothetical protein BDR22DRAFT_890107 [Usnea florida]
MVNRGTRYLALVLFHIGITIAAPPLSPASSNTPTAPSLSLTNAFSEAINTTKLTVLPSVLKLFPPGPPPNPYFYLIPDSNLIIEFSPLGLIPNRNETLVQQTIRQATIASLSPYRPQTPLSENGYHLQEGGFLLGVQPSVHRPGEEPLTWGRWTDALWGVFAYVQAYPRFDFSFMLWVLEDLRAGDGYVIGAGFAITRGR